MDCFTPSKTVWAGEQRRGPHFNIVGASSHTDHVHRAMAEPFHLADDIPLPADVMEAVTFLNGTADSAIRTRWADQLDRLARLDEACDPLQRLWNSHIPPELAKVTGPIRSVTLLHLMSQLQMGGDRWLKQFIYGFRVRGTFSQSGIFPIDPKISPPPRSDTFLDDAADRFASRAKASGFLHIYHLWSEAMSQVTDGWLTDPFPIQADSDFFEVKADGRNIAFRFAVAQMDKIRACDDFKYGCINVCCANRTPIKVPTWDHVGQLCLSFRHTDRPWSFFKADHKAAYKNLPLAPEDANGCIVALRSPVDHCWYGFLSRALLFGAVAAVLRYNCFSRIIAVLFCRFFGIPMINYFDDFGAPIPSALGKRGLEVFSEFCRIIGVHLKADKTELGEGVTFLGLWGQFPSPASNMLLSVDLPEAKKAAWSARIEQFIHAGQIGHKELESLTGRLSFSQTSIFGRFGRAMMQPLYRKVNAGCYQATLSEADIWILRRRAGLLRSIRPRIVYPRRSTPQKIIYTDAATSTQIIAAVVFDKHQFDKDGRVEAVRVLRARNDWAPLFNETNWIFGLELLAVVQTAADPNLDLDDKCITFYVDNSSTKGVLIRASSIRDVVEVLVRIFWAICAKRRITPWFEHVPSPVNIADLPTRMVKLPLQVSSWADFSFGENLFSDGNPGFTGKWPRILRHRQTNWQFLLMVGPPFGAVSDFAVFERIIERSVNITDDTDEEGSLWLSHHPDLRNLEDLPFRGAHPSIYQRIGSDQIFIPDITVPLEQEILFRTPSQTMGGQPLLITATVLMALLTRLRASARPSPDHFEPDRSPETNPMDCILLATMFRRLVASRLDGFTLTGLRLIFRLAKICGLRIENYPFRSQ